MVAERRGPGVVVEIFWAKKREGVDGRLETRFEKVKARNRSGRDKDAG